MKCNFVSFEEYWRNLNKVIVEVTASVTLTLFLMSNDVQVAAANSYGVDDKTIIEDAHSTQVSDSRSTDVTFKDSNLVISLRDNVGCSCADMMATAFGRISVTGQQREQIRLLSDLMVNRLKTVPAVKVTADFDSSDRCLEYVFLLNHDLIASVSKSVDSVDDDFALLTFIYKRNVVWAGNVKLSEVADHIRSIDSQLQFD